MSIPAKRPGQIVRDAEIDRLRAENAAKTEALDSVLAEHAKVGPELDRLRAENAEFKEWITTLNAKECDRLRIENAELLDGIKRIAATPFGFQGRGIARAILAKTAKEEE